MKKKFFYSSTLATLLSASSIALAGGPEIIPEPDYFSGVYIGGIGGVHHNTFNGDTSVVLTQPTTFTVLNPLIPVTMGISLGEPGAVWGSDIGGGEFDGYGGLQGGIGKVFNHQFYIGLQGFGEWGNSSETSTQSSQLTTPNGIIISLLDDNLTIGISDGATASASSTTTMKISNDYGLAGKFGWVVAPRSMIYGKVGASWADIKVSNSTLTQFNADEVVITVGAPLDAAILATDTSATLTSNASGESTKIGLLLGIGFEQFVYQDVVSINVEYDYTNYGHVSTGPAQITGTATSTLLADTGNAAAIIGPITGTAPVNTNLYSESSVHVTVSQLMAGINFYFGRDWF